jgi:hypothetical protein
VQVGSELVGRTGLLITCVGGRVVCMLGVNSDQCETITMA